MKKLATVVGLAFGTVVLAVWSATGIRSSGQWTGAVPSSMAEFLDGAELVSVAVVTTVVQSTPEIIITPAPTPTPGGTPGTFPPLPQLEASIVEVEVAPNCYILDDDGPRPIAIRHIGVLTETVYSDTPFPVEGTQDWYLYVLKRMSGEDYYYVPWGPCGRVNISESGPSCSDLDKSVPGFMQGMTSAQFVDAVCVEVGC